MKKQISIMIILILISLCLCGCEKKYDGYKITQLRAKPFLTDKYYVSGYIKNINNDECEEDNEVTIHLELIGNGDLRDDVYIDVECPQKGNEQSFEELIKTDLKSFKIKVISVY